MKNNITNCRVCDANISELMSYGKMPIANGFLEETTKEEYFFDLSVGFCESCYTFQLLQQPEPEQMFHDEYAFFSRQR
jgi:methylation protein EvaC